MKRIHRMVALLLAASMLTACGGYGSSVGTEASLSSSQVIEVKEPTAEDEKTAKNFCYALLKTQLEQENPVLSPTSAYVALGMTAEGAKEETLSQLENVLGTNYRAIANECMQEYKKEEEDLVLQVSNAVWVDDDLLAKDDWISVLGNVYQAPVYQRDLTDNGIVDEINGWVHSKTNGQINQMVEKPFDEFARAALFNAVYFKGSWVNEFSQDNTRTEDFTKEDGSTVESEMMNAYSEQIAYIKTDMAEGVILPYKNCNLAYLAIKPAEGKSVRELAESLDADTVEKMIATQAETLIDLKLPKYEVEYHQKLNDALMEMGVVNAFDRKLADFSELGESKDGYNLYISDVIQKAVVKVDEKGTEASAVTSVIIAADGMAPMTEQPLEVYFNEPFVYMIMDMETQTPLFIGIMDCPNVVK